MSLKDKYEQTAQMNLTSMVDVLFMLLIIVLITAPIMHAQVDLNLPTSNAARVTDESTVNISITADKTIYVDKNPVSLDKLTKLIWEFKETKNVTGVSLRADKTVDYGTIMIVIGAIKEGGIENLGLVAIPENKKK